MAEDLGEKSEQPTPKRQQEAREEGNVARSQDLSGALLLGGATLAMAALAEPMLGWTMSSLEELLAFEGTGNPFVADDLWPLVGYNGSLALRIATPLLLAAWVFAFCGSIVQIGWVFAPKALKPKMSKISPLQGAKRLFSMKSLVKGAMDTSKVAIVVAIGMLTVLQYRDRIVVLPYLELRPALAELGWMLFVLMLRIVAMLLLLGVLDFAWQKWKHHNDLKMTKQQVKDEMKQTDGDPDVRRRRMKMQQMLSAQRVRAAVPTADVIVTNPEHISIAIKYDPDSMSAPRVVAKGADFLALRIRQIAMQHGIPIVERKPLARALYRDVPVGAEIPEQFYKAVAEILAFVYRLNRAA